MVSRSRPAYAGRLLSWSAAKARPKSGQRGAGILCLQHCNSSDRPRAQARLDARPVPWFDRYAPCGAFTFGPLAVPAAKNCCRGSALVRSADLRQLTRPKPGHRGHAGSSLLDVLHLERQIGGYRSRNKNSSSNSSGATITTTV